MAKQFVCVSCGYVGKQKTIMKGNIFLELFLWLCGGIPGLIYSIWRLTTKEKACPECKNLTMIPVNSPKGRELLEKQNKK